MQTEALLLDRDLHLSYGTRELIPPGPGEVLVRVAWAGVCGSDLHVLRTGDWVAYWPATLGHEVVGVVERCPGGEVAEGELVVVDSRMPCGRCAGCERAPSLCEGMSWLGEARPGGFARHLVVPVASAVVCPPQLEPAIAVLAEPLAIAMHAVSKLPVRPASALVLGFGPVGALVYLELCRRWPGLVVHFSEPSPDRAVLARAMGARDAGTVGPAGPDEAANNGRGSSFSLVVDAAGYPQSLAHACRRVATGGTVLVVALSGEAVPLVPAMLVEKSITITGSVGFDDELEASVCALVSDPDRYRPLVTEAVLLEEAAERLSALADRPSAGKVVVRPWRP